MLINLSGTQAKLAKRKAGTAKVGLVSKKSKDKHGDKVTMIPLMISP